MIGKLNGQDATKDNGVSTDIAFDFGRLFRRLGGFVDLLGRLTEAGEKPIQGHGEFRVRPLGEQVRGDYGFSIRSGVDDAPRRPPFGNLHLCTRDGEFVVDEVHEPLVDLIDDGDDIVASIDLPGVLEDEILVRTEGKGLVVKTVGQRRLAKGVPLPTPVVDDSIRTAYGNGVLEIRARKSSAP